MEQDWPAWATEAVEVVPPDPAWPALAAALRRRLTPVLGPWLVGGIEHVGSTAVAGLAAKPIVDLLAPVERLAAADDVAPALPRPQPWHSTPRADEGWALVPPDLDGRPWRRLFVLPSGARRLAHLHLVAGDDPHVAELLAFRDALRGDAELAAAYATHKRSAATDHRGDREAYTAAKTAFVLGVLAQHRTR
ncbi:GrpB family protein [Egicoccus sp. AB-alg6-2]|uniref:GrpB family protein n=1 Tax=Egicoccus sp. AB-alg6-2 TaxID=3242692 RepID=UPI00359CBAB8